MNSSRSKPFSAEIERLAARLAELRYCGLGQVEAIVVTPKHDRHVSCTLAAVRPGTGVDGDGPYKKYWNGAAMEGRQISVVSAEVLDALGVTYEVTGDNIIVRGVDLTSIGEGDALRVGDAVLVATGAKHSPCRLFAARTSDACREAIAAGPFRGAFFDALDTATIGIGDSVEVITLACR